ncbi:Metallo-dependent hydrolase, partial [Punctularia strigosozonata HHB-11173 SS5]|uniref:Metallo-dependent hydrolase n=1 Tax=Punctularia strigosozonata (strain HHB-11173) TaxID=741275 RepID=UPI0004418326
MTPQDSKPTTVDVAQALHVPIAGPGAEALSTLTDAQRSFIRSLPKAELHAHLNGSIPLHVLQELARERQDLSIASGSADDPQARLVRDGLARLQDGVQLTEIHDFFGLFPAIYALTSDPRSLARATRAVLHAFLEPSPRDPDSRPQCTYLELRSTPRATPQMTREEYVKTVLDEVERYGEETAALLVSLDRRMDEGVVKEVIDLAAKLRAEGRRVVGVDLCGDPTAGDVDMICRHVKRAKDAGLSVTLHIAETTMNSADETLKLLACGPSRLGHATFLNEEAKEIVRREKMCIEICLSSNLLCKTARSIDEHHIQYYLEHNHPIAICTDDILPFRNSLDAEYAMLLAKPPFGLGLSEDQVKRVADMGMECRFRRTA